MQHFKFSLTCQHKTNLLWYHSLEIKLWLFITWGGKTKHSRTLETINLFCHRSPPCWIRDYSTGPQHEKGSKPTNATLQQLMRKSVWKCTGQQVCWCWLWECIPVYLRKSLSFEIMAGHEIFQWSKTNEAARSSSRRIHWTLFKRGNLKLIIK